MNLQPTISATAAVTSQQLADLLAITPSALCHHPELPQATPVHTGRPGKPQHAFTLEDLAAFAFDQTAHLSECEVRLRLALAGRTAPPRTRHATKRPHRLVPNDQGGFNVVPQRVPDDYSLEDQAALRGLVHGEQRP
ncbi:hypothetical protein [Pseudomonas sp. A2]|uniref:hypothetical protein n=1 Tax=Pseudomonas sp. A2 TaxID=107445 RepID=UPI001FFE4C92|nr:hypothetical protein [Pseudomonas sp. A2]UPK87353.1 hypothetical protein E5221_21300 [Pseudomonas sp. A2]